MRRPDPILDLLLAEFFARGGTVIHVPFGVSGYARAFRDCATDYGRTGWMKRHGLRRVPDDARPFVLSGEISLAQARAPLVWQALHRIDGGMAHAEALSIELRLARLSVVAALDILLLGNWVMPAQRRSFTVYRPIGEMPDWRTFLKPIQREAA